MEFEINKLNYDITSGSYSNVVTSVLSTFTYQVTSQSLDQTGSVIINTLAGDSYDHITFLPPVQSDNFTSFEQLSVNDVKSWVEQTYLTESNSSVSAWGDFTSSIENQLSGSVNLILNPTTDSGLPW